MVSEGSLEFLKSGTTKGGKKKETMDVRRKGKKLEENVKKTR